MRYLLWFETGATNCYTFSTAEAAMQAFNRLARTFPATGAWTRQGDTWTWACDGQGYFENVFVMPIQHNPAEINCN